MKHTGILSKMTALADLPVRYALMLGGEVVNLSALVGKNLNLQFTGKINCLNCGKNTKKSYSQGFCFPCTIKLAECDLCILKPETCHYDKGTCREPSWGEEHCLKPHVVYLANSSGLKVGITRKTQVPFRWIDQGATQALPILEVKNRLASGQVEMLFKKHIADKTDWRKMLKGEPIRLELQKVRDTLLAQVQEELEKIEHVVLDGPEYEFKYPVESYPEKVSSFNLDKAPKIQGRLLGIKGQYLIFDTGVFNVRSHSGYEITLEVEYAAVET
jgi:hypothetical protein